MSKVETIAVTLRELAAPGMSRKDLIAAVRERHPEATRNDVVRAAFYALTEPGSIREEQALHLHDFAIAERAPSEEDAEPVATPVRKKMKNRKRSGKARGAAVATG
ncbi:MAG: hypothetical protein MIL41_16565 [Hyphomicrobiales bacterium]|jgi:hypothetical protein